MLSYFSKLFLPAVITLLLVTGVNARTVCGNDCGDNPKVLFEYQFANGEVGGVHWGWLIDQAGNIKYYYNGKGEMNTSLHTDADGYVSKQDLENYARRARKIAAVSCAELAKKTAGTELLLNGSALSRPESVSDGFGDFVFVCYVWDVGREKYKRILLSQDGDTRQTNSHLKAVELTKWLEDINNTYFEMRQSGAGPRIMAPKAIWDSAEKRDR